MFAGFVVIALIVAVAHAYDARRERLARIRGWYGSEECRAFEKRVGLDD